MSESEILENIKRGVIEGDAEAVKKNVEEGLKRSIAAKALLDALIEGMNVISQKFDDGEIYLPEVMAAADAMTTGLSILEPELTKSGISTKLGTVVIGTVEGDIHDIGKNIVAYMLKGAGFEVIDLGKDVKVERYWEVAKEKNADIVAVSALMTTTTLNQRRVVEAGKEAGLYPRVKVLVGGACTTPEWAQSIGAFYAANAAEAVKVAKEMLGIK